MSTYRLSRKADADVEALIRYGLRRFGAARTATYAQGLERRLHQIASTPQRYPRVDHIRPGYRRSVYRRHAIYYRVEDQGPVIVRILSHQDPFTGLEEHEGGGGA